MSPKSSQAFDLYTAQIERDLERRVLRGQFHLASTAGKDDVAVAPANGDNPKEIDDAFIHDWIGGTFIPGANIERVQSVLKDFNRYKHFYRPEVVDSRLLSAEGNNIVGQMRVRKKKVITVVLNTEYKVRFFKPAPNRAYTISQSTRISEVENPGEKKERELPPGTGYGFLWRLNSYWTLDERDGGVYVECRAVSLTRDIPGGLAWAIKPMIQSLPRESLGFTLEQTRKAVEQARP